jgi:hypothetical protein
MFEKIGGGTPEIENPSLCWGRERIRYRKVGAQHAEPLQFIIIDFD